MEYNQIWKKKLVTATGPVLGQGQVFGGIITQVAGTSTTITGYDAATADSANLIIPTTDATKSNIAGVFTSPFGGAVGNLTSPPVVSAGLILTTGLYLTLGGSGSPAVWVLFR
jgi:hypothetical protein